MLVLVLVLLLLVLLVLLVVVVVVVMVVAVGAGARLDSLLVPLTSQTGNPLVEGVKTENSILPPLLPPSQVVGVKATILEYGRRILGRGNRESWGLMDTGGCDCGGHD